MRKNEEKLVVSTRKDCLLAIISSPWWEGNSQKEAAISWYVRRGWVQGSCCRESQMRRKGNHNFQLFLSYAWSLHHADNIVLYSRARCSLVLSCRYLLSFPLSANISLIVCTRGSCRFFIHGHFFRAHVARILRTWLQTLSENMKDREETRDARDANGHAFSLKFQFALYS